MIEYIEITITKIGSRDFHIIFSMKIRQDRNVTV